MKLPAPESADPFDHSHSKEEWDEYVTKDGKHRVAVEYRNGKLQKIHLRFGSTAESNYGSVEFSSLQDIQQLLSSLHAAVAGIHKRSK